MNRTELTTKLEDNHQLFLDYIKSLTDEEFERLIPAKWTSGQQLEHMVLGLASLNQALQNKSFVENTFGKIDRPTWSYDEVVTNYVNGLNNGGKAPKVFSPKEVVLSQKDQLMQDYTHHLQATIQHLANYSDEELDSLVLPHPFLGNLSIQELLYLMIYHALHHLNSVQENLQNHPA